MIGDAKGEYRGTGYRNDAELEGVAGQAAD